MVKFQLWDLTAQLSLSDSGMEFVVSISMDMVCCERQSTSPNKPWALSFHAHSCWICQEHKALTAFYSGHFSGLCLQQATLTDEVISSPDKELTSYCSVQKRQILQTQYSSPITQLTVCAGPPVSSPWDLGDTGNQSMPDNLATLSL